MLPILSIAPSLLKAGLGISQVIKGRRTLNGLERPEYNMPGEVSTNTTLAAQAYSDPNTAAQVQAGNAIGASSANATAAAMQSGGGAALAPQIAANEQNARLNLAVQTDAVKQQQQQVLMGALKTQGEYKDQEWQMNKFAPYADKALEARQQIGGGEQNIYNALDGVSALGSMFLGNKKSDPAPSAAAPLYSEAAFKAGQVQSQVSDWATQGAANAINNSQDAATLMAIQNMLRVTNRPQ